jgi:hypothetical protein
MNDLIKLITESDETPEFSDFYAEPEGTWVEQLVNFLISLGFQHTYATDYSRYVDYDTSVNYTLDVYELKKYGPFWGFRLASEEYNFTIKIPKEDNFPAFLDFVMCIKIPYRNLGYPELPHLTLFHSECLYNKTQIDEKVEFMKRLVEKTIALADEIRPTIDTYKLRKAFNEYIRARGHEPQS